MRINNHVARIALVLLLVFGFGAPQLSARPRRIKVGRKATITIANRFHVGSLLLQPGTYQIQHITEGENHFMCFREMIKDKWGNPSHVGKEIARVRCSMAPLDKKVEITLPYLVLGNLVELRIRGENVRHLF